ncbi:ATP-binding protein [Erythrobacter dokdonensis]|uniref:Putative DNA mismatch repair protein n=1 Tax=Erythrobacter dokdonensis DSW-74 TaxID=1300349 RepID=A0A1A7BME4_9SPHN|nr:ATP-binding protein [Erythrobacter dokdonensis]OBV12325.1 putative DNA mismatch repair protein [Erythrobacter dokdonensis DSW-74]
MSEQTYELEVKPDFIARQSKSSIETGLAELIWNALDADAQSVSVKIDWGGLGIPDRIRIIDDGTGIAHSEAPTLFRSLGGSWKGVKKLTSKRRRELHGKEGRGRFRALSLGTQIQWDTVYEDNGKRYKFNIWLDEQAPNIVAISEPVETDRATGTVVHVRNPKKNVEKIRSVEAIEYFSQVFAVYLMSYRDASIEIDGSDLDPLIAISDQTNHELPHIVDDGESFPCSLTIIEWNTKTRRLLFLANEKGFPVLQLDGKVHAENGDFSAYIQSDYFPKVVDAADVVSVGDRPEVRKAVSDARQAIKSHFRAKGKEAGKSLVETWKAEKVYPYEGEPKDSIDRAERQMFETVAVAVSTSVPEFEETPVQAKALHLQLLKHAIERSPDDLQRILSEVLKLPKKKQAELANLLNHSELSDIISAAAVVGERIKFLTALRSILFDQELKKLVKERSQLHKILEANTWVFGERYNLWASDKELTNVLKACLSLLGDNCVVDDRVKILDKNRGIVDLVLGRTNKVGAADEYDNLVVEIKAPKVKLNSDHVVQIEKYADAVAHDERFHRVPGIRWHFWLIADEYDRYVEGRISGGPNQRSRLIRNDDRVRIGIKTWGEVLDDNFARLSFVQERLKYDATEQEALSELKDRYEDVFADLEVPDGWNDEEEDEGQGRT